MRTALALFIMWAAMTASNVALPQSPDSDSASADDIMERSQHAYYFAGDDAKGMMTMDLIDKKGSTRQRVLTMLRRNQDGTGQQKYFMYFHEPGDVRGLTLMVWKYPERDDDRWIYVPAVDLIRQIAADDVFSAMNCWMSERSSSSRVFPEHRPPLRGECRGFPRQVICH